MNSTQVINNGPQTKPRELKKTIWDRQADALTLSGMLEGLDLMSGEGEQYDEARTAITRATGADTSDDALDKVMGKLDLKKKPEAKPDPKGLE